VSAYIGDECPKERPLTDLRVCPSRPRHPPEPTADATCVRASLGRRRSIVRRCEADRFRCQRVTKSGAARLAAAEQGLEYVHRHDGWSAAVHLEHQRPTKRIPADGLSSEGAGSSQHQSGCRSNRGAQASRKKEGGASKVDSLLLEHVRMLPHLRPDRTMYSPTMPMNSSCIDERKKNPITTGAMPTLNRFQKSSL
jgi:hypothetical protein